jgi:fumarylacetoacetate (FAA) hydrolase
VRLATLPNGTRDGRLWIVSSDGTRAQPAGEEFPHLRGALEEWDRVEPLLTAIARDLDADPEAGTPFDEVEALAPLPRTWQWLDASAFLNHGALLSRSLNMDPIVSPVPLMYQGLSHEFIAPRAGAPAWRPDGGDLDFEGEFAVILRDVPAGVDAAEASDYIALITFVNDWSLRSLVREEMMRMFGFIEGKPATTMAPLVVTPDELGDGWRDGRISLALSVELNGTRFGDVPASQMDYSFGELIAYAARTRNLAAGTVIGSGTVSNTSYAELGSACIAERRGIEIIDTGAATTPYLSEGDRVTMRVTSGARSLFGTIDQTVVHAPTAHATS